MRRSRRNSNDIFSFYVPNLQPPSEKYSFYYSFRKRIHILGGMSTNNCSHMSYYVRGCSLPPHFDCVPVSHIIHYIRVSLILFSLREKQLNTYVTRKRLYHYLLQSKLFHAFMWKCFIMLAWIVSRELEWRQVIQNMLPVIFRYKGNLVKRNTHIFIQ